MNWDSTASFTESNVVCPKGVKVIGNFTKGEVTIASGQVIPKGSLLGVKLADNKAIVSVRTATDGSQTPYGITLRDIDTSVTGVNADLQTDVLTSGGVDFNDLTLDASWNEDQARRALRLTGFTLVNSQLDRSPEV